MNHLFTDDLFYITGNVCECSASGDPHYKLFDGQMVHFQGVCTYKMAEAWRGTCGLIVHVKNIRSTRNPRVALTRTVYIFVGDDAIIIARNRILTVIVHVLMDFNISFLWTLIQSWLYK